MEKRSLRFATCMLPICALGIALFIVGCADSKRSKAAKASLRDPDVVRYRLLLRENAVDRDEAFRCYGACQEQTSPDGYLKCLMDCPGAEQESGLKCAAHEIPPVAACLTARRVPMNDEMDPGWVVLSVVAGTAIVISLASVCASSNSQCNYPLSPIGAQPQSPQ